MSGSTITRAIDMFTSRLRTLARLLDMAATQWRAADLDPETLMAKRLADDMFPLPYQVIFACKQPRDFAFFLREGPSVSSPSMPDPSQSTFADLAPHIEETIAIAVTARGADPAGLSAVKRIDISRQAGIYLELPGIALLEDWLVPNFYFHLVTAYDILRYAGVKIGKPDYMAHVGPYLRGNAPPSEGRS